VLAKAEALITAAHAEAVEQLLGRNRIDRGNIAVVGFHGQTVIHCPQARLTAQIGDGPVLARRLGIPVMYDFRAADVAAGGQGAPLVPVFHRAIVETIRRPHPVAVLNIGGVANVSYIDGGSLPVACDTGPGNALLDDFMRARTGAPHDNNGDAAAGGRPDRDFIARVLAHPFFELAPPKSLDRNAFAFANIGLPEFSIADGAVETADAAGWSTDALEAQAFAFLAVRGLRGLPITFPTTTGVPRPLTGGVLARP
jgi:anhydro-N-acetylmuramic acid kinase